MSYYENQIDLLIKSGANIIQVVSYEWIRVHSIINKVAKSENLDWFTWSSVKGLKKWDKSQNKLVIDNADLKDPIQVLEFFEENEKLILILEDFHPYITDSNFEVVRRIKELARMKSLKALILLQHLKLIPPELSKEMALLEIKLPDKSDLKVIANYVVRDTKISNTQISDKLLSSALGLTVMEAELAFRKAIYTNSSLTESEIPIIISEKENIIKKNGLLEYFHPTESLNSIGGLEVLKSWVNLRSKAFTVEANEYGISIPKGLLLLGVPGTGKSLTAKVIAKTWNFPLLRFDLGKVFGGIVGESEKNIRDALEVAKAIAPCVLWIDEIEKGLSGVQGSGRSDGGTASRVFGTFLTWLQEKQEPVFVVATANDISLLPPEMLRKGRFDEIFFVDLPSKEERINIFEIHIRKKGRKPESFNLNELAESTRGYTGAEIEEIVNEGMFKSFNESREPTTNDFLGSVSSVYPISKTMAENIDSLRRWAKVRARMASKVLKEEPIIVDPKAPRLKQEYSNPFINNEKEDKK